MGSIKRSLAPIKNSVGAFENPLYWFFCAAREPVKRFPTVCFLRTKFREWVGAALALLGPLIGCS